MSWNRENKSINSKIFFSCWTIHIASEFPTLNCIAVIVPVIRIKKIWMRNEERFHRLSSTFLRIIIFIWRKCYMFQWHLMIRRDNSCSLFGEQERFQRISCDMILILLHFCVKLRQFKITASVSVQTNRWIGLLHVSCIDCRLVATKRSNFTISVINGFYCAL